MGPRRLPGAKSPTISYTTSQAVLAIAIWATTDRVVHSPPCYNLPLHLVALDEIAPEWMAEPPVHVHYHYMFSPQHAETGMEMMASLGMPAGRLAWLAERAPLPETPVTRETTDAPPN